MSRSEHDSHSNPSNKRQVHDPSVQDKLKMMNIQQIHSIQESVQQNQLTSMSERVAQAGKELQSQRQNVLKVTTNSKVGVTSRNNTDNE